MGNFLLSGAVGLVIGIVYGAIRVNAPAPPLAALFGLLGMLTGQALVGYARTHWIV